ncbi:hypothetical protein BJY01DRAFT_241860 [Aspergillus pseudoustus]|uniref:TLDc domain-containing protein n=1 Tax=Aspergillus pseudoustus TaxID=1810923 RepID=A0ABR4L1Y8_9EURO
MDHQRCAALHNEILFRGWTGSGKNWVQPQTWWENQVPSEETARRLSPSLIEFVKRTYLIPESSAPFCFFFYLSGLTPANQVLFNGFLDENRYILLYGSSPWSLGDTLGFVFDLEASRATFIADYNDADAFHRHTLGWLPLKDILSGYVDMIAEGKVTPVQWREMGDLDPSPTDPNGDAGAHYVPPWKLKLWTSTDLHRTISAMRRVVNAIEARVDLLPKGSCELPPLVPRGTFAHEFLKAISGWIVRFSYIAPGIRFPTLAEFLYQTSQEGHHRSSLLIFQVDDDEAHDTDNSNQSTGLQTCWPPGAYIEDIRPGGDYHFANEFCLELPFRVGVNGFAKQSSGQPLGVNIMEWDPKPKGARHELYQSGFPTGFTDIRGVQIHKVLENWAGMIERGDWIVGGDGVEGGIRKFKEADTEEHWEKYTVPHLW